MKNSAAGEGTANTLVNLARGHAEAMWSAFTWEAGS
jgi:hypothetical protein